MLPNMFDSGLTRGPGLTRRGAKSEGGRKGVICGNHVRFPLSPGRQSDGLVSHELLDGN